MWKSGVFGDLCVSEPAPGTHWAALQGSKKQKPMYRQTSNTSHTLAGYKIVEHSDAVGASPVGAAPTTSSFST